MNVLIDALATFRLVRLATRDEVTAPLRARLRHPAAQVLSPMIAARVEPMLSCPWCLSWWVALGVVSARRLAPDLWDPIARALAFSAVTGLVATNLD